jgi:hypothetical protein
MSSVRTPVRWFSGILAARIGAGTNPSVPSVIKDRVPKIYERAAVKTYAVLRSNRSPAARGRFAPAKNAGPLAGNIYPAHYAGPCPAVSAA